MDGTISTWLWVAGLGGAGGIMSAWLARTRGGRVPLWRVSVSPGLADRLPLARLTRLVRPVGVAAVAACTAAATGWMIAGTGASAPWAGGAAFPAAIAFFWIGFVTAGWMAAERDKVVLHRAVCRAATAPAAHPDTVQALEAASPDAVYEAVQALIPRRLVR